MERVVYGCNSNRALEDHPRLVHGTCGFDAVVCKIAAIINANAGGVEVPQKRVAKVS